jgi:hypothetical protein
MSDPHPAPVPPGGTGAAARKLSGSELEAVIKRAVELQTARETDMTDGLSDSEVVRIGRDLGIEAHLVRRAISEVRSRPPEEKGMLALVGPGVIRAARTIRRPPAELAMFLEKYLLEVEFMVVERRFPDRTRYLQAPGIGAAMGRTFSKLGSRVAPLQLKTVDVGVALADEDASLVTLTLDLSGGRLGAGLGGLLGGAAGGNGVALAVLATTAPHLLALAGVGVLAASLVGSRAIYRKVAADLHNKLESFLDRLEHGELKLPPPRGGEWQKRLGL